ncbi:MAG: tetratricopeptide repeat protein [Candidatus Omnitrophica bacterium]|nr:tetratricopeptide repeat protein [Candidatus Omnitrophota bacterium]
MKKKRLLILLLVLFFPVSIFAEIIVLKSGKTVEGKFIEKTDKYIKIDFQGVPLIYYIDEIESIDGVIQNSPLIKEKKSSQENNTASGEVGIKIVNIKSNELFKDRSMNSIIYYQDGRVLEVKIVSRVKDSVVLEVMPGVDARIDMKGIDSIETIVPNLLNNVYINENYGISMRGPKDWVMVTPEGYYKEAIKWDKSQLVYFHKHPIEEYRLKGKIDSFISVVVDEDHPSINTAWDYAQQRARLFKKALPDILIDGPIEIDLNGRKWVKLGIQSRLEPFNMRQLNYFLFRGKAIFWISFGDTPDDFERELPVFQESLNSLELIEVGGINRVKQNFTSTKEKALFHENNWAPIDSKAAEEYLNHGVASDKQSNFSKDICDYTKAIEINPKNEEAYHNRGSIYVRQGNFSQAIFDFTRAIEINPNNAESYNNRGFVYANQGSFIQAISDFAKAIKINPNFVEAYQNRGLAYVQQDNLPQAISDYTKAIEIDPSYVIAYNTRGLAYSKQGNFTQAISDYTKAIAIKPNYIDVYFNRGIIFLEQGNLPHAISDLTKVVEINPNDARAYRNRALAYYAEKEYDLAWADVHKAEELGLAVNPEILNTLKKASGRDK